MPGSKNARKPPNLSPASVERAALYYLERYASSAENLRRVLMRRVARAARFGETDRDQAVAAITAVIDKLTARGLLSDQAYAEGRARSLSRRGISRARIVQTLAVKGVGRADADSALAALDEDGDSDLAAALRFARRKRLGPFRLGTDRAERRLRDLAAMGRAGYSGAVARRVVDAASVEALEEAVAERE